MKASALVAIGFLSGLPALAPRLAAAPAVSIAHKEHMLAYAAMMTGQREVARTHIRAMVAGIPLDSFKENAAGIEGFLAMPLEVEVRFGLWDAILATPDNYADYMKFTRAFRFAARAIAYAAKGNTVSARNEQIAFFAAAKLIPADETLGNNTAAAIVQVIAPMLEGEILLREGAAGTAIAKLREAVKQEDLLRYDEPPGWLIPVRHSLGAALAHLGRYPEAEQVYRDDLARLPENGWSLYGLSDALAHEGKAPEAALLAEKFRTVWAHSEIAITSSCLCQP